jgi:hypothetical protein
MIGHLSLFASLRLCVRQKILVIQNAILMTAFTSALGLAIAKAIIQTHQGSINVHNELDKGTNFIIKLPFNTHSLNTVRSIYSFKMLYNSLPKSRKLLSRLFINIFLYLAKNMICINI